jgi:hypothetical protein
VVVIRFLYTRANGCIRKRHSFLSFFEQVPSKKTPLQIRHEIALKLVEAGELDPYSALALVCWPPKGSRLEDVPLGKKFYSDDVRGEIRARHAAGESVPALALKTGIPFGQVKFMVSTEGGRTAHRAARRKRSEAARLAQAQEEPAELTLFQLRAT